MKKILEEKYKIALAAIGILILLIGFIAINRPYQDINQNPLITEINDNSIVTLTHLSSGSELTLETASTPQKRESGLMFRTDIKKDSGMFFVFSNESNLSFWMKNTPTSLDMIFLNSELKVTSIFSNTKTEQTNEIYAAKLPSQYVIETLTGWAQKNNVKEGDLFQITSIK